MAKGRVAQVIGTVVDIEFPPEELPPQYNAIEITSNGEKMVLEVQAHIGNNWVRCLSMAPTEGLERGIVANMRTTRHLQSWCVMQWRLLARVISPPRTLRPARERGERAHSLRKCIVNAAPLGFRIAG